MKMTHVSYSDSGFSLLELLIGISLLTMLILAMNQILLHSALELNAVSSRAKDQDLRLFLRERMDCTLTKVDQSCEGKITLFDRRGHVLIRANPPYSIIGGMMLRASCESGRTYIYRSKQSEDVLWEDLFRNVPVGCNW